MLCFRVLPYSGIQLMSFAQLSRLRLQSRGAGPHEHLTGVEKMMVGALAGETLRWVLWACLLPLTPLPSPLPSHLAPWLAVVFASAFVQSLGTSW